MWAIVYLSVSYEMVRCVAEDSLGLRPRGFNVREDGSPKLEDAVCDNDQSIMGYVVRIYLNLVCRGGMR